MKRNLLRLIIAAMLLLSAGGVAVMAAGQEPWKQEFDQVCSRTEDAMALEPAELKQLISRCDLLRPQIEKLDETQKKVYTKKLQMCRDLFSFVLSGK